MTFPPHRLEDGRTVIRVAICGPAAAGKSSLAAQLAEAAPLPAPPPEATRPLMALANAADGTVYRGFETTSRTFVLADPPDTSPNLRHIVANVASSDVSLIVVDAREGLALDSRRHTLVSSLLGVRKVALVVNKIDLVPDARATFSRIEDEYRRFATDLGLSSVTCIAASATTGDNIHERSEATSWYDGPTLAAFLESSVTSEAEAADRPLRFTVLRAEAGSHRCTGAVLSGRLRKGDAVRIQPAGHVTHVAGIHGHDQEMNEATPGQSVALAFSDNVDAAPGDLIVAGNQPADVADQFEATVIWLSDAPLLRGRRYRFAMGATTLSATVAPIKYKITPSNLQRLAATTLSRDEIGVCNVQTDRAVPFDPFRSVRETGSFLLIDRQSGDTVGAGILHFALRRAQNVHWQALDVNKAARSALKTQKACVLWYTGLSGAGKSTIANLVDKRLYSMRRHTYLLDGDNIRHGLNKDLGFTPADRVENIRRIAEVAKLMVDAGLIVGTAFISPFRAERQTARSLLGEGEFIEIFVDTPIGVAEQRDPKGLYKKARRGDLKNFTGIDSPYEAPEHPELRIDTTTTSPEQAAQLIVAYLEQNGILKTN